MATTQEREMLKLDVDNTASYLDSVVSGDFDDERDAEEYEDCDGAYDRLQKYFEDVCDVEFIVAPGSRGLEYRGAKILLACGGPTITLNTRDGYIYGHWGWGDCKVESRLDNQAREAVDNYFEELFDCYR